MNCQLCLMVIFSLSYFSSLISVEPLSKQPLSVISEEAPCAFVNNTVNVVSGAFSLQMRHLTVPGHVPLDLVQYYNSKSSYTPWLGCGMSLNYCFSMVGNDDNQKSHDKHDKYEQLIAESPGGSIIRCLGKSSTNSKTYYYLDPAVIHEGFTNCGSGNISARTNLKNVRLKEKVKYQHGAWRAFWTCHMPDGSKRKHYGAQNRHDPMNVLSEKRLDGTRLEFDYYKRIKLDGVIKQITAKAKSTLNWLKFESNLHSKKATITASNGKKATFSYFKRDDENCIYKIDSSDNPTVEFRYDRAGKHYCINKVLWPEGRFLEIEYDSKGRVVAQKVPIGGSDEKHTIWSFKYYDDKTKAYDANGNKKVFYHKNGRITSIQEYANNAPYRSKAYYWGAKSGLSWAKHPKTLEGNLMGHAVLNEEGCGTSLCYYEYDDFGNITKETTCGNLTGRYPWAFWINDNGCPKDTNVEKYHKFYKYNAEHLLTHSSEDAGPSYEYRYIAGKDLPWAKFMKDGDAIILREF